MIYSYNILLNVLCNMSRDSFLKVNRILNFMKRFYKNMKISMRYNKINIFCIF